MKYTALDRSILDYLVNCLRGIVNYDNGKRLVNRSS